MKTLNYFKHLATIIVVAMCISCSDSSESPEISSDLNFKVLNQNYEFYNYGYGDLDLKYFNRNKIVRSNTLVVEKKFDLLSEEILKTFNIETTDISAIRNIIIYGANIGLTIERDDISGLSIVKNIDGNLFMETYNLESSKAVLIPNFSKNYNDRIFKELFGHITDEINTNNNSFLCIGKPLSDKKINMKNGGEEEVDDDFTLDLHILDQYPIIFTPKLARGHECDPSDCRSDNTGFCGIHTDTAPANCEPSSYLEDQICPKDNDDGTPGQNGGGEEDPDYSYVARMAMYSVRDNILSGTTKGDQYIDFYYKIGYVWKVTNTYVNHKPDVAAVMDFIEKKSLLFISASNSTVIINSADAAFLRTKINILKNVHHNTEYQYIFTTLGQDLNKLENKTKSQILSML